MSDQTEPSLLDEPAAKFLERDFNQCFAQMRHYDDQIINLVKFTFTAYTALIGVAWGLYQFSQKASVDLIPVAQAILAVGFLVGVFMFMLVVRNRVYFVVVVRYINEHRRHFLRNKPLGFENVTRMYTNPSHPQFFNWRSSQAINVYLLSALNSALAFAFAKLALELWSAITAFTVSLILHLVAAIAYLLTRERKSADKAVFGRDATSDPHV